MKPEDIGPILALAEHRERKEWRRKAEADFRADNESIMPSPRCARARQFAYQVQHMLNKFIPDACRDDAITELMIIAYGHDIEIAQVPPHRDTLDKATLEAAMHGMSITRVEPNDFFKKPE